MRYFVFDLEATCWAEESPYLQQEIIEVGGFMIDRFGEIKASFESFVKPVIHPFLSPFCKKLTSIQQEHVDNAETFDRVFNRLLHWLDDHSEGEICYCSWGDADMKLLAHDCDYHGQTFEWNDQYLDVKKAYNRLISRRGRPLGLKAAISREGLTLEGTHHRALDDAYNLSRIFCRYIDEWGY